MTQMKQVKKWLLVLGLCGPAASNFSCATLLGSALRDAAIDGAANVVEEATATLLDRLLGPDEQTEP